MHFTLEAIIVGIVTLCVGYPLSWFLESRLKGCIKNKNARYVLSLFLTGVVVHITFELLGLNKVYCTQGYACQGE